MSVTFDSTTTELMSLFHEHSFQGLSHLRLAPEEVQGKHENRESSNKSIGGYADNLFVDVGM